MTRTVSTILAVMDKKTKSIVLTMKMWILTKREKKKKKMKMTWMMMKMGKMKRWCNQLILRVTLKMTKTIKILKTNDDYIYI